MKRTIGMMAILAFLATGAALGQEKSYSESKTKEKTSEGTSKYRTRIVTGTVKDYEAGKKITISGPNNKSYAFKLDQNALVEGNIAVGQNAKLEYTEKGGDKYVTVLSEAKAAARTTRSGSMYMASTTRQKGSKVRTETVVGSVKEYDAGKSITVTGPENKDYTFDLDKNVATKGSISVGERVKVSYTKTAGGQKVTAVSPYPSASHSKKTRKTAA
jgi:RNA recognition motif-containing protein